MEECKEKRKEPEVEHMRIWQEVRFSDIEEHTLIVDEPFGSCGKCREVGFRYKDVESCPKCGTAFNFVSSREAAGLKRFAVVGRMLAARHDLKFVDFNDFTDILNRKKADRLFRK